MNKFLITGAAAVLALTGLAGSALAQDTTEQVTVVPPFSMQQGETPLKGGMKSTIISFNRTVSYGDLDLSKQSDRDQLSGRIDTAARDACRELDAKYPQSVWVPTPESQDCVGNATRGALAMANIPEDENGVPE
jgi:UrcA family protein